MLLQQLQHQFQLYLTDDQIQPLLPEITDDANVGAKKRLAVYFDAYRLRLRDIMRNDFTKTHTLLGDDGFDQAFYTYLTQHPSTHFSVRYFGQHFADFLAKTAPFSQHPILAEMATFEWLISHTLDAADAPLITQSALAQLSPAAWPDLLFHLHPSVISHYFHYDTPALWQDIDAEKEPRMAQKQASPIRWVFNRQGLRSLYRSCNPVEDIIFSAILSKASFSDICEALIDQMEEEAIPLTAAQTLYNWVQEEFFCEIPPRLRLDPL